MTMSSRSVRQYSSMSLSGGLSQRISSARAPSVYAGAGGSSVRISYGGSSSKSGSDIPFYVVTDAGLSCNEKATMQNLNDRLASYLEKVRSLEAANAQLERQIREWYQQKTPVSRDYSHYEKIIAELRAKIGLARAENEKYILRIDNARLAAEDFQIKYQSELALRQSVEGDIVAHRKLMDDLTITRSTLEMRIEELKEELIYLKKNHQEEMTALRANMASSSVNVEVDAAPQEDLARVLEEIRSQYQSIIEKNRREMEGWYKEKFDTLNQQVQTSSTEIQTSRTEISELKRTLQALEIELQSQLSLKMALEGTLRETESRFNIQLNQLQDVIYSLETELTQVRQDTERQASEYKILLDIKTRLEMEIAEYRRLLDGEQTTVTKIEVQKQEPVVTRKVRTVIEELVDGKVVSRSEDVDVSVLSGEKS